MRIQKKVAGKLATTSLAKGFIDDKLSGLLDTLHAIAAAEVGSQKADKLIKNIIKIVVKIALLYKNNKFSPEELAIGFDLRKKIRSVALTVVSFYEVDFTYDADFLHKNVQEIGELAHSLVKHHLTDKSHGRIDNITSILGNTELLDTVFVSGGKHNDKLSTIATVFAEVVDTEW